VNGGDITTSNTTASVFNTNATTINAFGVADTLTIGANNSGTATIRNQTVTLSAATALNATLATAGFSAVNVGGGYGGSGIALSTTGDISADGNLTIDGTSLLTGAVTAQGGISVDGATTSDIIALKSTANLFNATATTINFGAGATTGINIGASGGTVAIAGPVTIANGQTLTANGAATIGDGGDAIALSGTTVSLTANGAGNDITATLVDNNTNAFNVLEGANNYINVNTSNGTENVALGNASTNPSFSFLGTGTGTFGGSIAVNGGDITTSDTVVNLFNTNATTINFGGGATTGISIGAGSGTTTINHNLTVSGATTSIASTAINLTGNNTVLDMSGTGTLGINTTTDRAVTFGAGAFTVESNTINLSGTAPAIAVTTAATPLTINAGTSGAIQIGGTSTGDLELGGGSGSTGCTLTNSSGAFSCSGDITTTDVTGNVQFGFFTKDFNTGIISNVTATDTVAITSSSTTNGALAITTSALTESGDSGFNNTVTTAGSVSTPTYYGQRLTLNNNHTGTADTVYGQYITFADASGSLANTLTGIYVDTATTNANDVTYAGVFLTGNVGIGDSSPAAPLTVGNGDLFQVASTGNVTFNFTAPTMTFGNTGALSLRDGTSNIFRFEDWNATQSFMRVGAHGTTNGAIFFGSSGAGTMEPSISASASGNLWVQAPGGTTVVGSGFGHITINPGTAGNQVYVNLNSGGSGTGDFNVRSNGVSFLTLSEVGATTFTQFANQNILIDAANTNSTLGSVTAGVLNLDVDTTANFNTGFSLNYESLDGVAGSSNLYAQRINLTQTDSDGGLYGLYINMGSTAVTAGGSDNLAECLLCLANQESQARAIGSAILISGANTAGAITNGISMSGATDITNDLVLQNGEIIDNNVDGTIAITATTTTFSGDITVTGNGITFGQGESINNDTNGDITVLGQLRITLDAGATTTEGICGNQGNGNIGADVNILISDCSSTPSSDYMEMYPAELDIEPGDIVIPSTQYVITDLGNSVPVVTKATSANSKSVIGIISDPNNAGDFNSIGYEVLEADNPMPLALSGRVLVKIASTSAEIFTGDYITVSEELGKGKKATTSGYMVGKALEGWDPESGATKIMVLVNNTYASDITQIYDGNGDWTHTGDFGVTGAFSASTALFGGLGQLQIDEIGNWSTTGIASASAFNTSAASITANNGDAINSLLADTFNNEVTKFSFNNNAGLELLGLDSNGNATISGTLTTNVGNYDLAEDFPTKDNTLEAGDVVSIDTNNNSHIQKSTKEYDNTVLGIYSEKPGFRLSQIGDINGDKAVPVALSGRVPVKVNNENGPIHRGDYLTSSSTPGVAMKATRQGQVLGKALEDFTGTTGKVMTFVNITFADPGNILSSFGNNNETSPVASHISAQSIDLPQNLVINGQEINGSLNTALLTIGDSINSSNFSISSLQANVLGLSTKASAFDTRLGSLEQHTSSISSQLAATLAITGALDEKVATTAAGISELNRRIEELLARVSSSNSASVFNASPSGNTNVSSGSNSASYNEVVGNLGLMSPDSLISSQSATVPPIYSTSTAQLTGDASVDTLSINDSLESFGLSYLGNTTISGDITVSGQAFLSDASVLGEITVGGDSMVISSNAINVKEDRLFLQNGPLSGSIDLFNGKVTIERDGTFRTVGNVEVEGDLNVEGAITITATAGENISARDALYVFASGIVKRADATFADRATVVGIAASSAKRGATVKIIVGGKAKGFNGLKAGKRYFLKSSAGITSEAPLDILNAIPVGIAFSDKELIVQLGN